MVEASPVLADLQMKWPDLHDLDRAQAVRAIKRAGFSIRKIAQQLKVSEALLRHLLQALKAPPDDQVLARDGKISTKELVRRAKSAMAGHAAKLREVEERKRARASVAGCNAICKWLAAQGLSGAFGEQIILEARRDLAEAEQSKRLPRDAAPAKMPVSQIIQHCRPAEQKSDEISFVAWFAQWLGRWAFYAMPDAWVRFKAIELALENQCRR